MDSIWHLESVGIGKLHDRLAQDNPCKELQGLFYIYKN
ncbi:hypothetical protein NMS_0336 [Nonlabens marinus S1-08]|uniref:Uncharacterized protein n=1 Tax=Nonlabens marinus S1-08 TaxID=1454201 RepID=W8VP97_9FLAO|nr:hypothetical protein NMS_0336 [Nonlabens marinus S1-08]